MGPVPLWLLSIRLYRRNHRLLAWLLKFVNYRLFLAVLPYEGDIHPSVSILHRGMGVIIHPNTTIGRNVSIGHLVMLSAGSAEPDSPYRIIVEDDVIIGSGAIVMCRHRQELRLGRGCVVGAGAIVTRSVGPREIVASPRAEVIGMRPVE